MFSHLKTRAERIEEVEWGVNARGARSPKLVSAFGIKVPTSDPCPLTFGPGDSQESEIRCQSLSPQVPQKLVFVHSFSGANRPSPYSEELRMGRESLYSSGSPSQKSKNIL